MATLLLSLLAETAALGDTSTCTGTTVTAHVIFTGLMTFVDQTANFNSLQRIDPQKVKATAMTVIVPDVHKGRGKIRSADVTPHVSAIAVESKYLSGDSADQTGYLLLPLNREDILVDPSFVYAPDNAIAYHMDYDTTAGDVAGVCPSANDKSSLYWMPRLLDLVGSGKVLNPYYVPRADLTKSTSIAARIDIPYGRLESRVSAQDEFGFKPADSNDDVYVRSQAIAQEIHWTFTGCNVTSLTVSLQQFGAANPHRKLTLKPIKNLIELYVENVPFEYVVPNPGAEGNSQMTFDPHFSVYYEALVAGPSGEKRIIPFVLAAPCPPTFGPPTPSIVMQNTRRRVLDARSLEDGKTLVKNMMGEMPSPEGINCGPDHVP